MKKNVIKTIMLIAFVLASAVVMTSFSKSPVTVKGYIQSYGNAPFTYPVITTTKGKTLLIISSDKTKQDLLERQGKQIKITGYLVTDKDKLPPNSLKDGAIKVETWEVIDTTNKKKK